MRQGVIRELRQELGRSVAKADETGAGPLRPDPAAQAAPSTASWI